MAPSLEPGPRCVLATLSAGLLTVVFGFALHGMMEIGEEGLRDSLRGRAEAVIETVYQVGGRSAAKAATDDAWALISRARMIALIAGTLTLTLGVATLLPAARPRSGRLGVTAMGAGSIMEAARVLIAGVLTPSLGSTGSALDRVAWLAPCALSVVLAGFGLVVFSLARHRGISGRHEAYDGPVSQETFDACAEVGHR